MKSCLLYVATEASYALMCRYSVAAVQKLHTRKQEYIRVSFLARTQHPPPLLQRQNCLSYGNQRNVSESSKPYIWVQETAIRPSV